MAKRIGKHLNSGVGDAARALAGSGRIGSYRFSQMSAAKKALVGRRAGSAGIARTRAHGELVSVQTGSVGAHWRMLVEALPVGFIIADRASVLTYANQHFVDLLGYAREELLGRPLAGLVCPSDRAVFVEFEDAFRSGRSNPIKVVLFQKNGGCVWVQLSFVTPPGDGTSVPGICMVVTNIADLTRREVELRRSNDELRALSAKIIDVQEYERQRIAADLHDSLGQSLTVVKCGLEQSLCLLGSGAAGAAIPLLSTLLLRMKEAAGEVRRVAMNARPSMLDDLGLAPTLCWLFREFETVYTGIALRRQVDINEGDLSSEQKATIYRIVQEAINNAAKHSHASAMDVSLRRIEDQFELAIRDNGRGFDPEEVAARPGKNRGIGLASIRDRALFAGGTHALSTAAGQGVEIRITLPLAMRAPETAPCAATGWTDCAVAARRDEILPDTELNA